MIIITRVTATITITGHNAAIQNAQSDLKQQSETVQKVLDGYFEAVNARADRQFKMLEQWLPGEVSESPQLINTNGQDLPVMRIGGAIVNGNTDLLERFKTLTGGEIAVLSVHSGKLYRASTLLKKDGKAMHGSEIAATDPVAAALLAGKDYSGLTVRTGKYFFSKVKVLKDGWTVSTKDASDASHWEHSIAVHDKGIWVLTAEDGGAAKLAQFGVKPVALG